MQEMNREQIIPMNIEDEMSESYIDYAMSVIVGRALPDVRDGLKPVHRRIVYAMYREGLHANKPHSKCAGVVGEVLKKYHPHGDLAVYDALVRMAQPWNLRYPLIDGQGNFGSVDGNSPAAYRYTEARLSRIAELLLTDIDKDTVGFIPNFDGKVMEPTVLPSAFPNLLVNGSSGIAVGMATNIPPHNLGEVIDALQILLKKPEAELPELLKVLPGPDFPTSGYIYGREGIIEAYRSGRGKFTLRGRMVTEQLKGGREAVVINEIPYQVNLGKLFEDLAAMVRDKKIQGIVDMRDETNRDGIRIVMELRRGENAQVVINQIYKQSQMQVSYGVIMLALVNGRPRYLSLKKVLTEYITHRREIVVRRTRFDLDKARKRLHIVQGLKIAINNIDEVIKIIRSSDSTDAARTRLKERFDFSEEQAVAILDMPLRRLTGLEIKSLEKEHDELVGLIEELASILADPKKVVRIISKELDEVKTKHGDKRLTEITDSGEDISIEDMIAEERMVITVSHEGYIKRTPTTVYRNQRRGGRGVSGMDPKENDWVEHLFIGTTHNYILFLTNKGKAYWLKVWELPQGGRATRGRPIVNMLELEPGETVKALLPVEKFSDDRFLIMATRGGQVVRNTLSLYSNPRKAGIKAINIDEGDELIGAKISHGDQQIFMGTRGGMAVRFEETQIRPMGRFVGGVRGIRLREGDEVIGLEVLQASSSVLTVCANGYGKRTEAGEYRLTNRGGIGVINIKSSQRNGEVIAILDVLDSDELIMISEKGIAIRCPIKDIRKISRATQGVRIIRLDEGDTISSFARIEENKEPDAKGEGIEASDEASGGSAILEDSAPEAESPEDVNPENPTDENPTDDLT